MSDELKVNEQQGQDEPELTLEDLFQEGIDQDELHKTQQDSILPAGTYTTEPPVQVKIQKDKNGRPVARFWAKIVMGDVRGAIGFQLSWVRKNKADKETGIDTGKPDMSSRNYAMAGKAYEAAYGEKPQNVGALLGYVRDYPVRLRVIQTQDAENMVVSISAVRQSS